MLEHGRKIAAILAADVVGYSRLMGVDEVGTLAALNTRRALFTRLVQEHEGHEFGSVGDSLMAQFPSAVNAVHCAQAIQQAIAKENEPLAPERRMSLRIGVNLGDVLEENGALFGDGVNVAARLQALAEPGGILISGAVYEHVKKKLPNRLSYAGTRQVKNIAEPVAVYEVLPTDQQPALLKKFVRFARRPAIATISLLALLTAGALWWTWRNDIGQAEPKASAPTPTASADSPSMLPDRPSLAVLPFDSVGGSPENSYFADGMTDDIITDLSRLSGILVIARNSSWTYKGKPVMVQQVAKDLGVRYVLEGSVRRVGDTVRINARLVDALGGQHLWANRYDGSIRDVFSLQDRVIKQIVDALAVNLTHDERTRVEHPETLNPQAYDAVLQGWAHYREGSEEGTNKAIALFERAIALDPEYARAHAAVAAASWRIVQTSWESTTLGGYQRAFDRMQVALVEAMRRPNALAHAVSAEFRSKQGLYAEAFEEINRALALAPNDPDIHLSKARILNATGRAAEGEESVRWAMVLDPLYSPDYLRVLAISLFNQQRYEEAIGILDRLLLVQTDVLEDYSTLIASLGYLGRKSRIPGLVKVFNESSTSAGYNLMNVQMWGGWWWYGDIYNYDPVYRDRLMEGLRKAGIPEGAGTDIPLEKYRKLLVKNGAYYDVTGATTIDLNQAKTLHDRGVKFVDVRAAKGFADGHIPGAFNLDVATELSRDSLSRIVGKDEEVVLSCHGKTCPDSAYASAKAVMWGFKHVYYFSAGFPAWKEAGYPVEASPIT